MIRVLLVCIFVLLLCPPLHFNISLGIDTSYAQEDILDGFGDDFNDFSTPEQGSVDEVATSSADQEKSALSLPFDCGGSLSLMATFNTSHHAPEPGEIDWRGLSALRSELKLEFQDKIFQSFRWFVGIKASHDFVYGIRHSDNFSSDLTEDREMVPELDKAYIGGRITDYMDVSFGRQIVVWGKSDSIRVVDVINPLDMREPGLTDIEDLRRPLTMSRLDFFWGDWTLKAIAIHEIRFDALPVWGSDYYPSPTPLPAEYKPESRFENTEYAVSLGKTFNGGDVSLYYAYLFNDAFHFESLSRENPPQYLPHLEHDRITMVGFDFNKALGNFMFKTEMALFLDMAYINPALLEDGNLVRGDNAGYTRYDGLIGFEYMGFNDTVISFDAVVRTIDDFDLLLETSPLNPREKEEQWVARLSRTFKNETLTAELLVSGYGWSGDDGAFERFKLQYNLTDDIMLTGGFIIYQSGAAIPIETIGDNDRIFCDMEYSF
ncbi:MAG: hypothetical protein KKD44_04575 [Proteobacteria bacterium]|nr:hypothetical protein [Pseudomonadota bacterium]